MNTPTEPCPFCHKPLVRAPDLDGWWCAECEKYPAQFTEDQFDGLTLKQIVDRPDATPRYLRLYADVLESQIKALKSQSPWIACSERKPELIVGRPNYHVIVWWHDRVAINKWDEMSGVSHWMPIPPIPPLPPEPDAAEKAWEEYNKSIGTLGYDYDAVAKKSFIFGFNAALYAALAAKETQP